MKSIFDYQVEWSGLENRIAQMVDPKSGRTVMLAVDHGYFHGAPEGLKDLKRTIEPLLPYCDAISPTIGGLRYIDNKTRVPIILRATGGNSMAKREKVPKFDEKDRIIEGEFEDVPAGLDDEIITVPIEEIIRKNAIGFTVSCYVGMPHQRQTIQNLTTLATEGHKYGLIAIGITAVGRGLGKDQKYIEHASRLLSENGADIIKTYYCDGFEQVVESCLSPIVIAGGKKLPTEEALEMTYNAIQAGAIGVDMGRNIFQDDFPTAMIQAVRAIVHNEAAVDEACDFYQHLIKNKEK